MQRPLSGVGESGLPTHRSLVFACKNHPQVPPDHTTAPQSLLEGWWGLLRMWGSL